MMVNENAIILAGIIQMQGSFTLEDLYVKFEKMGIRNKTMIRRILEELCESEYISYSEKEENIKTYEVKEL